MCGNKCRSYSIGYYPFPNLIDQAWQDAEASTMGLINTQRKKPLNHVQSFMDFGGREREEPKRGLANICITVSECFELIVNTKLI